MEAAQVPIDRQVDKNVVVHLHNGILFNCKKNEILNFVTVWINLEGITLSEINQTEEDKYHMISLTGRI